MKSITYPHSHRTISWQPILGILLIWRLWLIIPRWGLVTRRLSENVFQCCHVPYQSEINVVNQQTVNPKYNQQNTNPNNQNWPSTNHIILQILIRIWLNEHPYHLSDNVQKVCCQHNQYPQKLLIILPTDTIV